MSLFLSVKIFTLRLRFRQFSKEKSETDNEKMNHVMDEYWEIFVGNPSKNQL